MLRLVDFNPEDFEQVSVFKHKNADTIKTKNELERIFSLIAQWGNISNTVIKIDKNTFSASIEFDENEIAFSELIVKVNGELEEPPTRLVMCTEVFNQCYFIEEEVVDIFFENGNTYIVIDIPESIKAIKQRSYFRTKVEDSYLLLNGSESVELLEIDTKSFVISTPSSKLDRFEVQFIDCKFNCKVLNEREGKTICVPESSDMDLFFRVFAYHSFPNLIERKLCNYKDIYKLYGDTGYFGNFNEKLPQDHFDIIKRTWSNLDKCEDKISFDFVIKHNSSYVGVSSASLYSIDENVEKWYIHQLCSIKDENFFDYSGLLYIWRLVYLSMRPGDLKVYASFKSSSRWIEKIFLKYVDFLGDKENLHYVKYFKASLENLSEGNLKPFEIEWSKVKVSENEFRYYANNDLFEVGVNPTFLNANGNLNCIIFKKNVSDEVITSILLSLKKKFYNINFVRLCFTQDQSEVSIPGYYQKSDRFYSLDKKELLEFAISITHTIEQLKRKYAKVAI